MARYAIVNSEGLITNIAVWDGATTWPLPENTTVVLNSGIPIYEIDGTLINGVYTPPEEV